MKTIRILFITSLFMLFSCNSDLTYEQKVSKYVELVNKSSSLIEEGKFTEALDYSNAAIEITDTVPSAIYLRGVALLKLDRLEEAEESLSEVIEMEGKTSGAYRERAKVYLKTGDNDFIDDINTYLDNYPNDEQALLLKRNYLEEKEDFDGAIIEYSVAIAKDNGNIGLLKKRAELYFKNGDYQKSVEDYEKIIKLDPKDAEIERRKVEILTLMDTNGNRNIFIAILVSIYLIYAGVSLFVFKPMVNKKAITQIGGEFEVSKDPLLWFLPISLTTVYLCLLYSNLIPNF